MNSLERINALIAAEGRTVKYGVLTAEDSFPLITLYYAESDETHNSLYDGSAVYFPNIVASVYSQDYLSAVQLLENIKAELKAAVKDNVKLMHKRDLAFSYDKEKSLYIVSAEFKEIKN